MPGVLYFDDTYKQREKLYSDTSINSTIKGDKMSARVVENRFLTVQKTNYTNIVACLYWFVQY